MTVTEAKELKRASCRLCPCDLILSEDIEGANFTGLVFGGSCRRLARSHLSTGARYLGSCVWRLGEGNEAGNGRGTHGEDPVRAEVAAKVSGSMDAEDGRGGRRRLGSVGVDLGEGSEMRDRTWSKW